MTSKERIHAALNNEIPDRVPMNEFLYSRNLYEKVLGHRPSFYNAEDVFDCAYKLGLDSSAIPIGGFSGIRSEEEEKLEFQDEWNITYRKVENVAWPGDAPISHPLKNRSDWKNFSIPDIKKPSRIEQISIAVQKAEEYKMAAFGTVRGPFTSTWMLFGYEHFSALLYDDPDLIDEVAEKVMDFYIEGAMMMVAAGVDAIWFADDFGGTSGPLMSPNHFRKHIWKPLARLVDAVRSTGTHIVMHSDGDLCLLLSDLVKIGISGYHPMERHANMDIEKIKKEHGDHLTLIGNVSNQDVLIYGSVEEVVEATKECLRIAAPAGGYILGSDHSVHDDMPNENIIAMIETCKKYGKYPIHID